MLERDEKFDAIMKTTGDEVFAIISNGTGAKIKEF